MNSKDLREKKEDESSDLPAWQLWTAHLSVYMGRNCSNGPDYSPTFSLQSWFSTVWLLCSCPPEGGTQRTLYYRGQVEVQRVCEEHRHINKEFCATGLQHMMQRWKECVDNEGVLVKKWCQICKGCEFCCNRHHNFWEKI